MTTLLYGAEAKERGFWKTEDYLEMMVWKKYEEQYGGLSEKVWMEGTVRWAIDEILKMLSRQSHNS